MLTPSTDCSLALASVCTAVALVDLSAAFWASPPMEAANCAAYWSTDMLTLPRSPAALNWTVFCTALASAWAPEPSPGVIAGVPAAAVRSIVPCGTSVGLAIMAALT